MCCDDCYYYSWYYDWCTKWKCEMDQRAVHNCFEKRETPILDAMVGLDMKGQSTGINTREQY